MKTFVYGFSQSGRNLGELFLIGSVLFGSLVAIAAIAWHMELISLLHRNSHFYTETQPLLYLIHQVHFYKETEPLLYSIYVNIPNVKYEFVPPYEKVTLCQVAMQNYALNLCFQIY